MNSEQNYWLDDPRNVNKIVYALCGVCLLLLLCDLMYDKHVHFDFEHWFGFSGFFGLIACVALALAARILRVVLKRGEDYYDP
jgi:hypothetical protein